MMKDLLTFFENAGSPLPAIVLQVANHNVRLHFSKDAMDEAHLPPFAHLPAAEIEADFDFYTFIYQSSAAAWLQSKGLPTTLHRTHRRGPIRYSLQPVGLFWMDESERKAFFWLQNPAEFPHYRAKPLFRLFHWLFDCEGWMWCHAAAVGNDRGAVILPGFNAAGKSTTAAAALLGGLHFLGDDCPFLHPEKLEVLGIYASLLISEESKALLQSFDRLKDLRPAYLSVKNKYNYHLYPQFAAQLKIRLPLKALLLPQVSGEKDSRIGDVSREEVMNSFISSIQNAWWYGSEPASYLRQFYRLTQQLPLAKLHLGTDLSQAPGIIHDFINGLP